MLGQLRPGTRLSQMVARANVRCASNLVPSSMPSMFMNGIAASEDHSIVQKFLLPASPMHSLAAQLPQHKQSMPENWQPKMAQATDSELLEWMMNSCGLQEAVAQEYRSALRNDGFDSPAALAMTSVEELSQLRIRTGHARLLLSKLPDLKVHVSGAVSDALPPPRLFDYSTITSHVTVADAVGAIEHAFAKLAQGEVEVPLPMHIGIEASTSAGPGDCHIKGGYVNGTETFTVKLACVSFYKNVERGLPPGSGVFVVTSAVTGAPLAIMHENRYLTDLRTGAAGAVAVKYLTHPEHTKVGFIGTGAIAKNMARAAASIRPYKGYAFARKGAAEFCAQMQAELGLEFVACDSAEALCRRSDVVFTQTPGAEPVLSKSWLRPHATVIASGSDQPTKQELPVDLVASSKYVCDLTKQAARVGELRSAIAAKAMLEADVYAELGEIVSGKKPGRQGNETIVVDLTGTGAQDAAIGQVAWDKLSKLSL